jgi:hypothetical protein
LLTATGLGEATTERPTLCASTRMATAVSPSASNANIRKLEKIFILKDGINVFPNLNSGKMRKFQGFGNLCVRRQPEKWQLLFFFSKN